MIYYIYIYTGIVILQSMVMLQSRNIHLAKQRHQPHKIDIMWTNQLIFKGKFIFTSFDDSM